MLTAERVRLRRPRIDDVAELIALRALPQNRHLLQVDESDAAWVGMLQGLASQPWGLPMVAERAGSISALLTGALPDVRASRAYLLALFDDLEAARVAARLYVRHMFWSFPVVRFYAQVPDVVATEPHVELLTSVGFLREGTYPLHGVVEGQPCDIGLFGLLREDFEAVTAQDSPELRL